jgi:hypothetical protein
MQVYFAYVPVFGIGNIIGGSVTPAMVFLVGLKAECAWKYSETPYKRKKRKG